MNWSIDALSDVVFIPENQFARMTKESTNPPSESPTPGGSIGPYGDRARNETHRFPE